MKANAATQQFISEHLRDNVSRLALAAHGRTDIDLTWALQQIAGRQKATEKIPSWSATEGMIYPPHINLEQCSSEQTARYKATIAERLLQKTAFPQRFIDLTGGFGVDFAFITKKLSPKTAVYVELNSALAEVAAHNFNLLGLDATIVNDDAVSVLQQTGQADIIYIDPSRRNNHGSKTYAISDCTPNLLDIASLLTEKAQFVMVKLSPMLDWHKAVADIEAVVPQAVREVHILSVRNECKELLIILSTRSDTPLTLHCVNDDQKFTVTPSDAPQGKVQPSDDRPLTLFLPNASIMKAGIFDEVAAHFRLHQLAPSSHLFLSTDASPGDIRFPGKAFTIIATSTMNRRALKEALQGISRANISVRNFPLTAEALRKRLHIADGGDIHIFGTTRSDNTHILIIAREKRDFRSEKLK